MFHVFILNDKIVQVIYDYIHQKMRFVYNG